MTQDVAFSIKFVDPQLKHDDIATEVLYLIEDLRDLDGMSQTRFESVSAGDEVEAKAGVKFAASAAQLESILRRLRDRLYHRPVETCFRFQISDTILQIQTHQAEDLMGLMAMAQTGLLFSPERDYLAEAETYSRTQGELSPTELDNLDLLRQRLDLSVEQAEVLNASAAGPYRTQAEKQRYLEDITAAEFSRLRAMDESRPFAPKNVRPVLQELAENLGLPSSEAEDIYQKYQQRYDDDASLKTEQKVAKTAEDSQLAAAARAAAERQKQVQQNQSNAEQYRNLCRQAIAERLYPSEFDQGRLDQARRLWGLSVDQAVQLEAQVRDELYGSVESAAGVDHSRLRNLLHQQAWHEADLETETVILKALDRDMQPVTAATVPRLSPVDLATVDGLWSLYSKGRFGFKAQQQVYRAQQQIQQDDRQRWLDFQQALGWREAPSLFYRGYRPYQDLDFSLDAPAGHLPTWRWCCPSLSNRYKPGLDEIATITDYLNDCMPLEAAASSPLSPALPTQLE
ncbi:MAG: GUN4 domain-containing protein [Nodosilinea sp.]